jgi:transcriptional regulator with XRE-family HTH domain
MRQRDFGKRLVEIRRSKGLTQEELSDKCNVTVRTIRRIESGSVVPRSYTIRSISEALGENLFDIAPSRRGRESKSIFRWVDSFKQKIQDLFNLKASAMKKVPLLSFIIVMIGFGLYKVIQYAHEGALNKIDYSEYTQLNSRGVIYFFPV